MSLTEKLLMPRRLMIAGLVASVGVVIALMVQILTHFDTQPYVRTLLIYLVFDYIWASLKREFFPDRPAKAKKRQKSGH
jgi:hypothetical protein